MLLDLFLRRATVLLSWSLLTLVVPTVATTQAPTASFTASPNPAVVGRAVTLDASASTNSVQYHWEWQDENGNWMRSGSGAQVQTSWSRAGTYQVHLWVYNSQSARADAYGTVTVNPDALPTASITVAPNPPTAGYAATLDGSSSRDAEGPISGYFWEWQDENGNWSRSTWGAQVQTTWSRAGTYGVNLYVYDGRNQQGRTSTTVTVRPDGLPTAVLTATPSAASVGQAVALDGTSSYDAEGPIAGYYWEWQGSDGNWSGSASTPTVRYTWTQPGTYAVNLHVYDGRSQRSVIQRHVTVSPEPALALRSPSPTVERGTCVTVALPGGAASECGDLRLAHGLPAVSTLNKARTPTLLYNSQHAAPTPVFTLDVQVPTGVALPDRVTASLSLNGRAPVTDSWAGSQWQPGQTRRLSLATGAAELPTGVYPYTVEVSRWSGTTAQGTRSLSGEMIVVNRTASPFGTGWWMAGVEELKNLPDGRKLWVGGDGSARIYAPAGSGVWLGANPQRPDTLLAAGTGYLRVLPGGGGKVRFDVREAVLVHVATEDRLGRVTEFDWSGGRLRSIRVPVPGRGSSVAATNYAYELQYGNQPARGGLLSAVVLRAESTVRTTRLWQDAQGRMDSIQDPASAAVRFAYAGEATLRVRQRWDRAGTYSFYEYDHAGLVRTGAAPVQTGLGHEVRLGLRTVESATLGMTQGMTQAGQSVLPDSAFVLLDGPRTDVVDQTRFWTGPWGAPERIRDAGGSETTLTRGEARFPALVTAVDAPAANGGRLRSRAWYNARGLTDSTAVVDPLGDGRNAVTRVVWHSRWNAPITVTAPEGEVSSTGYDEYGRTVWQQVGPDAARRVNFGYNALGLAEWVQSAAAQARGEQPERYAYDVRGNLASVTSPGQVTTTFQRDALGRDTLTTSPIGGGQFQTSTTRYDAAGQVRETITRGPAAGYTRAGWYVGERTPATAPAQTLRVWNDYDAEGRLRQVARWSEPDAAGADTVRTWWAYDALGRRVRETVRNRNAAGAVYLSSDTTIYDAAGNVTQVRNRRGDVLTMEYDALGRLRRRVVPSVSYPGVREVGDTTAATGKYRYWNYPLYSADAAGNLTVPNEGSAPAGLVVAQDVEEFIYDAAGNLLSANNRDARVTREYHRNGQMRSETQQIRTYAGADFSTHSYRLEYTYDLNGRRREMLLPDSLVAGAPWMRRTVSSYDPGTGALKGVGDSNGQFGSRFVYNAEGQLEELGIGADMAQVTERTRYDVEGRTRWQNRLRGTTQIHRDTFTYDLRGKIVRSWTMGDSTANVYSGLGMLAWSHTDRLETESDPEEEHLSDAMGNTYMTRRIYLSDRAELTTRDSTMSTYEPRTGRLGMTGSAAAWNYNYTPVHALVYDSAGNQVRYHGSSMIGYPGMQGNGARLDENTRSYYGANGKLRVVDRRTCAFGGVPKSGSFFYGTISATEYTHDCAPPPAGSRATFEEHRYDALGRRVLTRTVQGWACELYCVDAVTRTVWDGDQVVAEIRAPFQEPERDRGVSGWVPFIDQPLYGRVLYQHGGRLDQPAVLVRLDYDSVFPGEQTLIPQTNWLGNYDSGTFAWSGQARGRCIKIPKFDNREQEPFTDPYSPGGEGGVTNPALGDSVEHCVEVPWPALYLWKTFQSRQGPTPRSWAGSLILGKRDESGLMYMRNRYYDPTTGRFTQEDPIGIAGGLNVYGFANGDPVSNSDPFGLAVCSKSRMLRRGIERAVNASIQWDGRGCVSRMSQVTFHGGSEWQPVQHMFGQFVVADEEYWLVRRLEADCRSGGCSGDIGNRTFAIYDSDFDRIDPIDGNASKRGYSYEQCGRGWFEGKASMALGALIIHELLWHGQGRQGLYMRVNTPDGPRPQSYELENVYNRAHGRPLRCAD